MEILQAPLNGALLLKPAVFEDSRGFFYECYQEEKLRTLGIEYKFVQDNLSKSRKNTIRGLHYQVGTSAQGKLCQVILGKVIDVLVDIRFNSPTYGKYFATELSEENHHLLWIPPGFAHGFSVQSDIAIFHYKCTNGYDKKSERTILYSDPDINIDWQIANPIVSDKDLQGKLFADIDNDFIF